MTVAPSKPAFEAIVDAGAYHKSKCPLSANTEPQINAQVRNFNKTTLRAFWIIFTPLFWSSFLVGRFSKTFAAYKRATPPPNESNQVIIVLDEAWMYIT